MRTSHRPLSLVSSSLLAGALLGLSTQFCLLGVDSTAVKKIFKDPPREYATAPLWVWNDLLTERQIRDTMRDLAKQKVKQVFVHPRPGLMTPYLSPDWFRLWKVALDEASKLDMNVWIYDENSYPSGFAGGWVPEQLPESRGMGLHIREAKSPPKWTNSIVAVFRLPGDRVENVTAKVKAGESLPEGQPYRVASIQRAGNSPWHGDRCYVNLLTPGVTEKFLDVTLGAYEREIGKQFGKRVPGVFTDEPNIRPAGGFPWCPDLPEQFEKRWGYSLVDNLVSLVLPVGDWEKVRHNYFSTISDLFIERWAKPFYERCDRLGLEFTGHYWDHEWPHCIGVPDNMAMAAWQHRPGVDTLMNQYAENTHAQFGNVRYCREVSSLANQLGRKRTLVELYGAGGWDLRFEDMKRIGDWLQVLGINTMDEHLSYITLRGARKRDHPQSFSYHEPWWDAYHVNAQYLSRLSAAMSQGEQINRVLVIEPTTTAWMYQGDEPKLRELGDSFFNLLMALEAAQVEYDLGCEDVMARHGVLGEPRTGPKGNPERGLKIGQRDYHTIIIPTCTKTLNSRTKELLDGVNCQVWRPDITRLDGRPYHGSVIHGQPGGPIPESLAPKLLEMILQNLRDRRSDPFSISRSPEDKGILFHHRRTIDDGEILLLVNTSIQAPSSGTLESDLKGIEQWNLHTGQTEAYPFEGTGSGTKARYNLPPSGSLLLFLSKRPLKPAPAPAGKATTLAATAPTEIRPVEPNVLALDYVDVTAGGETRTNQYFYKANQFAWQKNGMQRNPWDSAVQFKDELITKKFPAGSGFTASYRFTIEGSVPKNLAIVIERPDLYSITCNGRPLTAKKGSWWLDKAFGRIPIAAAARSGENVVTVKASPFTIYHELEPAYVLGDFTLKSAAKGWVIAPEKPLQFGSSGQRLVTHDIRADGAMWLSGGIGYEAGVEDRQPAVTFDLGGMAELGAVRIWNYNEAHVRDLTVRGAAKIRMAAAAGPGTEFSLSLGEFDLRKANGRAATPQELKLSPGGTVRQVRITCLSNHSGTTFPAAGSPPDAGFVGLAEVQFLDRSGRPISGVRVTACSSELRSLQRLARNLVDGSGLGTKSGLGWDEQGRPFYAQGVSYRQRFEVPEIGGRFRIALPDWYGSVARVSVNGKPAGHISSPPWECDVTPHVRRGANTIEVVVLGTLKNLLGPHHGNHALGSAWPGMFQNGPDNGPPPGERYSTVSYGLFEPFVLKHTRQPDDTLARNR